MKNKNKFKKSGMIFIVILLSIILASFVSAQEETKPIAGYIYLENSDGAYNATVIIKANIGKNNELCGFYQSDPVAFAEFEKYCYGCNCTTPTTFSYSNGIYTENLANLVQEGFCEITSENAGDECGDDWSQRPENTIWAEIYGNTINPSQGNAILSPIQITEGGGTQWLTDITLPAGPDLSPEIVDISPDGWVANTQTILFVETNEYATCKYSTTSKAYAEKEYTFNGNTRYHNKSITLSEGTNNFYIQCQDESSLLSNEVHHIINLDTQTPVTTDDFDDQWRNTDAIIELTSNCGPSNCDWTKYCLGTSCTPNLDYTGLITITDYTIFNYRSKDIAGNTEDIQSTQIKIDKEIPTTFDNYGGGTYNYDVYVTITSSCGLSSCQWTKYCTGSSICTPDTDYSGAILFTESTHLRYHSQDFAGNQQSVQTTFISIDKSTPPSGGGGSAAERHYPGELVELEELPEPIIPEPSLLPPTEEETPITLPKELPQPKNVTIVEEPSGLEKINLWWYVIFIIILLIIIWFIFFLAKRRKKDEEEEGKPKNSFK